MRLPVVAVQNQSVIIIVLRNPKGRMVVDTRKQLSANKGVESRRRVPTRDKNAFLLLTIPLPLDRDSVGSVFGGDANE
jgi:hypothetical protein